jgi:anti-sigma B factor antagonist
MLQVSITQQAHVTVAAVSGSLDALTADQLSAAFSEQFGQGRVQIVADLAGVEYTSSAGVRVLLGTLKEARQRGGDLRLAGARDAVRRVLDFSGFTSIIKTYPDVASAAASFPG